MAKLEEVFGIRAQPVQSYAPRQVDGLFVSALATDNHIVIYGSSKQGKTSLRQKHVPDSDVVIVSCSPQMSTQGIYSSILRQSNIRIQTLERHQVSECGKITTKFGFKASLPWTGEATAETAAETGSQVQDEFTEEFVSFDFSEAQSIGELLQKVSFNKFVVLENYHYLSSETKRQLAFDLKTFHEIKIRFVILGIWWQANYLMNENGDLQDRVVEIPVEPWEDSDFKLVAETGSLVLKISIDEPIIDQFISNSYGNIGMFQEFLKEYCRVNGVLETTQGIELIDTSKVEEVYALRLTTQRGQLLKTLQTIAAGSRTRSDSDDPLLLPYYLTRVICRIEVAELRRGVDKNRLLALIREIHRRENKDTIRINDITYLVSRLSFLQKKISPPFLYFDDSGRRLFVVDARYFFVLEHANREELEEDIPFPTDLSPDDD